MWILRSWLAALCVAFVIAVPAEAQTCQSFPPPGVAPMPLALTPVTLQILQPSLIPVPGTDGFIHLAFAAQMTNLDRKHRQFHADQPGGPAASFCPCR